MSDESISARPGVQPGGTAGDQPSPKKLKTEVSPPAGTDEEGDAEFDRAMDTGHQEMDALMDQYLDRMGGGTHTPGQMMKVPIISIQPEFVLVDVGEKAEGYVARAEVSDESGNLLYRQGDVIEVMVKGHDSDSGLLLLSHAEARRRAAVTALEAAAQNHTKLSGRIIRAVKGGLIVDLGVTAFLPASQIDLKRIDNLEAMIGETIDCVILEFEPRKRRIVVSRRKLLEDERNRNREETLGKVELGKEIEVRVKRLTEFGAFVDLGGIDGLIPRSEISWRRSARPEDVLKVDEIIQAKVIDVDKTTGKVTLSRKQSTPDPWECALERFAPGAAVEGDIVSLTNYGAFVRLEEGVDGMIHISDMAWDSGGKRPADYLAVGQRVQASVLGVNPGERRISLGLKQLTRDPWADLDTRYPRMTRIKGKVTGLTKYGAFVELEPGIEGMIHVSDFSWDKRINQPREMVNKGDDVEACVLDIDIEKRRISLGVKQLTESPIALFMATHRTGQIIEAEISEVSEVGVILKLAGGIEGFIHISQLERDRVESIAGNYKVGDMLRAEITKIDGEAGRVALSRRQMLKKEERKVLANYTKSDRGGGLNMGELLANLNLEDDLPKR